MKKIAIYGGTFDPIHNGHVRAAIAFLRQSDADVLYIIPTANPPHKERTSCVSAEHRLKMCAPAFSDLHEYGSRIVVSDFEALSGGTSYTVLTLRHFAKESDEIELLCGTDMFLTLDKWYMAEEIFGLAKIAYIRREHDGELDRVIEEKKREYEKRYGARVRAIEISPTELTSSEVREKLESSFDTSALIPKKVDEYIKSNRLYM